MTQWHWDPETYLKNMLEEVPAYPDLQEQTQAAAKDVSAKTILELGTGTGETATRIVAAHPDARLTAIDSSEEMLARARSVVPQADLRLARLEDPLPDGPFDLVVSALAVHHLDGAGKQGLFSHVPGVLRPGGHFVLGDVVVPPAGQEGPIEIDWVMDKPESVDDQLAWLREAGFEAEASSVRVDLAVFRARLSSP